MAMDAGSDVWLERWKLEVGCWMLDAFRLSVRRPAQLYDVTSHMLICRTDTAMSHIPTVT